MLAAHCVLSLFCQIIPRNIEALKILRYKVDIFAVSAFLWFFCSARLWLLHFIYRSPASHCTGAKSQILRKGVFFLLIYSHNLMNPQTESRAKKRGEKREDRAREKEVTSSMLSLSQTYHHHQTTWNHPRQLHQERRRQKEEDEAEQYRKLSVQEAAYRKLSQQYEVCDMQKLYINIIFYILILPNNINTVGGMGHAKITYQYRILLLLPNKVSWAPRESRIVFSSSKCTHLCLKP